MGINILTLFNAMARVVGVSLTRCVGAARLPLALHRVSVATMPTPAATATHDGEDSSSEPVALSKKALRKASKKAERMEAREASASAQVVKEDPLAANYGDVKLEQLQSREITDRKWSLVSSLGIDDVDKNVLIRGRAQDPRAMSSKLAFLVVRQHGYTVQCVAAAKEDVVSREMVKYVSRLTKESIVDVEGVVSNPGIPITGATQQVELQLRKVYCVSRSQPQLPLNPEDAARSEQEIKKALEDENSVTLPTVGADTRLEYRSLDLRTPAKQAIFKISSAVQYQFREFLRGEGFTEIHTPKLIAGASEGGAAVFKLKYYEKDACLAQSPQLHKQMAIAGDLGRVYEIGPVFRAEKSSTHRHLAEFTGLDLEMEINEHYFEIMEMVGRLFTSMFDGLKEQCKKELEAVNQQFPFEPLQYHKQTLKLTFAEGIELLKEAGVEVDPFGDLSTETEKKLGKIVKDKYGIDFYILHRFPMDVRPFYTMPAWDDVRYSNSFDVFIRCEEIISGGQRVHDVDLLTERAQKCNIDLQSIEKYIDSFKYGMPPHGGFGVGLERVVMLYLGLPNIRMASLFPRDPQRLAP